MNHVWVVEMWTGKRWEPTAGVSPYKASGTWECRQWSENNPEGRFRLTRYIPAGMVYVVRSYDGAGVSEILGVFSSAEAAKRAKRQHGNYQQYDARTVDAPDDASCDDEAWDARRIALDWSEAAVSEHEVED